jgi:hypothetical protein
MRPRAAVLLGLLWLVGIAFALQAAHGDAMERMNLEKLKATHDRVEALKKELHQPPFDCGYDDVRALLHVHSKFSHDSRGTIEEILDAAKKVGARVVMFTEHPASHYDYIADGHHGMKDGVLLIPGAETEGFLAYPKRSIDKQSFQGPQQFADRVRETGGLIFLCHLEERMDWEIAGLTGSEIYNTHADFKDEPKFLAALRSPLTLLGLIPAVSQYPQETFAALEDYPADYLKRFDALCQKVPHTGVSANDAHHNQAYRARVTDEGKVQLEDALDKKLALLDPEKLPLLKPLLAAKKPGDVVFQIDLDPYERSFRHVSTHLLMDRVTEEGVWESLQQGRAYVAFDWMADPTGFAYQLCHNDEPWPMGIKLPFSPGFRLRAAAPLGGKFKLVRNGEVIVEQSGDHLEVPVTKPGVYRVEVWLTMVGEDRPWILSNPIYVLGR